MIYQLLENHQTLPTSNPLVSKYYKLKFAQDCFTKFLILRSYQKDDDVNDDNEENDGDSADGNNFENEVVERKLDVISV